jgi:TATA-binding protein-associated factor Taf7
MWIEPAFILRLDGKVYASHVWLSGDGSLGSDFPIDDCNDREITVVPDGEYYREVPR